MFNFNNWDAIPEYTAEDFDAMLAEYLYYEEKDAYEKEAEQA